MEVLRQLDGVHLLSSSQLVRQNANTVARIEADMVAIVAQWNSGRRPDMKYAKRQKLTYRRA